MRNGSQTRSSWYIFCLTTGRQAPIFFSAPEKEWNLSCSYSYQQRDLLLSSEMQPGSVDTPTVQTTETSETSASAIDSVSCVILSVSRQSTNMTVSNQYKSIAGTILQQKQWWRPTRPPPSGLVTGQLCYGCWSLLESVSLFPLISISIDVN